MLVGLQAASGPPAPTRTVLTAARDLPAGTVVARSDLARSAFLTDSVPAGSAVSAGKLLGRTTTGPVRRGEPLTDVRLVGGSLLDGYPGRVAAPVRVADPGAVALLRVGDLVDVNAADPQGRNDRPWWPPQCRSSALPRTEQATLAAGGPRRARRRRGHRDRAGGRGRSAYLSVVITH